MDDYNVLILNTKPWAITKIVNGEKIYAGAMTEMLNALSQGLNFSHKTSLPRIKGWGNRLPNGTWTGFLTMIQSKEADFTIIPTAYTVDRYEDFHLTPVLFTSYATIMSGGNNKLPKNMFGYFLTFNMEVWVLLFLSLILMTLLSLFNDYTLNSLENKKTPVHKTFSYYLFIYLAGLFNEGTPKTPKRNVNKFNMGVWLCAMLILLNAFTGQFKSSLMLVNEANKINSVEDLANRADIDTYLWKGGVFENLLRTSKQEAVQRVAARVFKRNTLMTFEEMQSQKTMNLVQMGKISLISETSVMKVRLAELCASRENQGSMYLAKEPIQPLHLVFVLNKNLPEDFRKAFDRKIQKFVEGDLVEKWLNELYGDWKRCEKVETSNNERTMGFEDLQAVFVLWVLLLSGAIFVFIGEILFTGKKGRKHL